VVFNKKLLSSLQVIIFKTLLLVKTWRPLLKPKLKLVADEMISLLSANAYLKVLVAILRD
jgi:energy-converting hydrogenase Eha subunit C